MNKSMKKIYTILAILVVAASGVSCNNMLNVSNPNNQTAEDFGSTESDLQEAIIACYNNTRMEGSFSRVGYMLDVVRGDEVWNASQVWYLPFDDLNAPSTDEIGMWPWREWFYVVNRCNFVITKIGDSSAHLGLSDDSYNKILGQALFIRGMAYYELATYYQTVPLFNDYSQYATLETIFANSSTQDQIFDQAEEDLSRAMKMLPSRDAGGEWATGRATCGAAAGYYARVLMFRHKYDEALTVLRSIIAGDYGHYDLMADFGDNFKEGAAYENNKESLYEVQYLDYGQQGTDDEWTPVNTSSNATNGHALESNFGPGNLGGWADLAMSPWVYSLFKAERCTDGRLDPRLYWTSAIYEAEYDNYTGVATAAYPGGDPRENVVYQHVINESNKNFICTNTANGGIPIAKHTYARLNTISTIVTGLHCGVNVRMMRYSDVLLRAAECINEESGPTKEAIDYINKVRNRAALPDLPPAESWTKDKLFEQIANVERPKEFACENGRGIDLLRWGFFYDDQRLAQIREHSSFVFGPQTVSSSNLDGTSDDVKVPPIITDYPVTDAVAATYKGALKSSLNYWTKGHEYLPVFQGILNANPHVSGNSANNNTDNSQWFTANGWTIHPVVELD